MKKHINTLFGLSLALISIFILHSSSSNGRAFSANSGNTGAPGESTTCRTCHGSGFGANVSLLVKDVNGNPVTSYVPGNVYEIEFKVNSAGSPIRYGFQMVTLLNGNVPYNAWTNPSGNTRIASVGARTYAEHAGPSLSSTFKVDWTAPPIGTGNVRFFGGGVAANNNGRNSGDGGNTTVFTLAEGTSTSIAEYTEQSLKVYPNPVVNILNVELKESAQITLINLQGKTLQESELNSGTHQLNVEHYENGIYFIRIQTASKRSIERFIKS